MRRQLCVLASVLALVGCSSEDDSSAGSGGLPEKDRDAEAERLTSGPDWYRHTVFAEIYVRSYADSDGDGIGDFRGLTTKLDYLESIGVGGIWLMPIMPTPFIDSGYDVADYTAINPDYGTLADFDEFMAEAKARGIRVIIDLVLNHTSDQHAWFQESRSSRDNPKADWYVWSDEPDPPDNGCGLNQDFFGDSAWQWDETRQQYYFHRFYAQQPDLNYESPEVVQATLDAARFWLDRGVSGFRCDVIGLLYESATECDFTPKTRDYVRQLRGVLDEYDDRVMVAESTNFSSAAEYFGDGSDMFHLAFNFSYGYFWAVHFAGASPQSIVDIFTGARDEYPAGAQDALVIGSHDVVRSWQAAAGDEAKLRRAALVQLTMPGTPFIYYGEELGMRSGDDEVVDFRDSARTPMLWSGGQGYGFTTGTPWLDYAKDADTTHLEAQRDVPGSTFEWYREVLDVRRGREAFGGRDLTFLEGSDSSVLVYLREGGGESYLVAINMLDDPGSTTITGAGLPGSGKKLLGDATLSVDGDSATIEIGPGAGAVFRVR